MRGSSAPLQKEGSLIKRAFAVLAAALVLGVAGGATASTASATIIPREGHYSGHDHNHNHIGLNYTVHGQMNHFTIDYSFVIGGAHVSNALWHPTCHNGYCTSGAWVNKTTIQGHYWHGGSPHHKVAYTVHWTHYR